VAGEFGLVVAIFEPSCAPDYLAFEGRQEHPFIAAKLHDRHGHGLNGAPRD
jgi:hypothetical protein